MKKEADSFFIENENNTNETDITSVDKNTSGVVFAQSSIVLLRTEQNLEKYKDVFDGLAQ